MSNKFETIADSFVEFAAKAIMAYCDGKECYQCKYNTKDGRCKLNRPALWGVEEKHAPVHDI